MNDCYKGCFHRKNRAEPFQRSKRFLLSVMTVKRYSSS